MLFPDASGGAGIARLSAVFARPLGFEPRRGFGFLRGPAHRIGSGVRGNHPAKLPLALEDRPPEITGKR